jgi:hypothetical protein
VDLIMPVIAFLVFLTIFILLLFSLFRVAEGRSQRRERRGPVRRPSRLREARTSRPRTRRSRAVERSKLVALQAMRRAGYDVGDEYVRVTDIGLLEYRGRDRPHLLRSERARTDSDYLRPFVELWLPYRSRGMVRFELVEQAAGRTHLHYADEDEYDLEPGINALLPSTWLPLQNKEIDASRWHLRVLVGDIVLADHGFGWRDTVGDSELQRYIASDGELSPALKQALSAEPGEAISLDDLLGR